MGTCSGNGTQERAVQDLLCLVALYLFDLISAPPLSLSHIGCGMVLLCLVCFAGSLYLGFRVWNGHVTRAKAEHWLFVSFFGLA